jgi:hypothetical protein
MVMVQAFGCLSGNSDRFPGESRNNDMEYYFDLGVQHQITISGNNKLELRADILIYLMLRI